MKRLCLTSQHRETPPQHTQPVHLNSLSPRQVPRIKPTPQPTAQEVQAICLQSMAQQAASAFSLHAAAASHHSPAEPGQAATTARPPALPPSGSGSQSRPSGVTNHGSFDDPRMARDHLPGTVPGTTATPPQVAPAQASVMRAGTHIASHLPRLTAQLMSRARSKPAEVAVGLAQEWAAALADDPAFGHAPPPLVTALLQKLQYCVLQPGATLMAEGRPVAAAFVLLSGRAGVDPPAPPASAAPGGARSGVQAAGGSESKAAEGPGAGWIVGSACIMAMRAAPCTVRVAAGAAVPVAALAVSARDVYACLWRWGHDRLLAGSTTASVLRSLPPPSRAEAERHMRLVHVPAGAALCVQGAAIDVCFVLVQGRVLECSVCADEPGIFSRVAEAVAAHDDSVATAAAEAPRLPAVSSGAMWSISQVLSGVQPYKAAGAASQRDREERDAGSQVGGEDGVALRRTYRRWQTAVGEAGGGESGLGLLRRPAGLQGSGAQVTPAGDRPAAGRLDDVLRTIAEAHHHCLHAVGDVNSHCAVDDAGGEEGSGVAEAAAEPMSTQGLPLQGPGAVIGADALQPDGGAAALSAVALTPVWAVALDVAAVDHAVAAHGAAVARMLVSRDAARFHGGPQFTSTAALQAVASAATALRTCPSSLPLPRFQHRPRESLPCRCLFTQPCAQALRVGGECGDMRRAAGVCCMSHADRAGVSVW